MFAGFIWRVNIYLISGAFSWYYSNFCWPLWTCQPHVRSGKRSKWRLSEINLVKKRKQQILQGNFPCFYTLILFNLRDENSELKILAVIQNKEHLRKKKKKKRLIGFHSGLHFLLEMTASLATTRNRSERCVLMQTWPTERRTTSFDAHPASHSADTCIK